MDTPMAPPMDIAGATPANTQTDAGQSMPAQGGGLGSPGFNAGAAQTNTEPGGHAKLFNMLQMMGVALSATGKAIATHGREGGEPDVAAFQEQQQREQIATQQAAQQKQEGDLRMKALQAQTNQMVLDTNTKALMAPAEIRDKVTQAQSNYAKFLTDDLHLNPVVATAMMQGQDFGQHLDAVHQGLNNNLTDNTIVPSYGQGKAGGEGGHTMGFSFQDLKQTQVPKELIPSALASFTPVIEQAKAVLGANDPRVQAAQGVVDNMGKASSVTAYDVQVLGYNNIMQPLMAAMSAKQGVMDFQKKQADTQNAQNQATESGVKAKNAATDEALSQQEKRGTIAKTGEELKQMQGMDNLTDPFGVPVGRDSTGRTLSRKEYDPLQKTFSKEYVQPLNVLKKTTEEFDRINNDPNQTGAERVTALLNAVGISGDPLKGKGFRISNDIINEHAQARNLWEGAVQKLNTIAGSGGPITSKQISDYTAVAQGVVHDAYVAAAQEARRQGMPVDFLPKASAQGQAANHFTAKIYLDAAGGDINSAHKAMVAAGYAQ